jgi:hypothetical protein
MSNYINQTSALTHGAFIALLMMALLFSGCGASTNSNGGSAITSIKTETAEIHDHPSEGPHHGDLVELGNEEFHAEVVHGDNGMVSVYLLDSSAKTAVPINAKEITLNLSHKGEAEQFKLPASPVAGDHEGKSSHFSLMNEHLANDLDEEGVTAKLVLLINDKQYTGKIEHHHDHEKKLK